MPELVEVETIRRQLEVTGVEGQRISCVELFWERTAGTPDLAVAACGQKIEALGRRGKFLIFHLSRGDLLVHLRMTGRFAWEPHSHQRAVLQLGDGRELFFIDPRKFGRLYLDSKGLERLHRLGPEPLEMSVEELTSGLGSRRQLKALLLGQEAVAGLGNIYVDEALWVAGLHPLRPANSLNREEVVRLYGAIQEVLQRGLEAKGTSLGKGKGNYYTLDGSLGGNQYLLHAYGRAGEPCGRCGTALVRTVVAQRGTTHCPSCQEMKCKRSWSGYAETCA